MKIGCQPLHAMGFMRGKATHSPPRVENPIFRALGHRRGQAYCHVPLPIVKVIEDRLSPVGILVGHPVMPSGHDLIYVGLDDEGLGLDVRKRVVGENTVRGIDCSLAVLVHKRVPEGVMTVPCILAEVR